MNTTLLVVLLSMGTLTITAFAFGTATLAVANLMARLSRPISETSAGLVETSLDHSGYRARPGVKVHDRRAA